MLKLRNNMNKKNLKESLMGFLQLDVKINLIVELGVIWSSNSH